MGEPISLGKATSLQPSPVKTAPSRPREPAGRGLAETAAPSVGDRQDQAPDGGGQSGAATGTQAALLRQRHEEVPAVGDEIVGKELAGEAVAMLHA